MILVTNCNKTTNPNDSDIVVLAEFLVGIMMSMDYLEMVLQIILGKKYS